MRGRIASESAHLGADQAGLQFEENREGRSSPSRSHNKLLQLWFPPSSVRKALSHTEAPPDTDTRACPEATKNP
ncbi:hypothetical protein B5K06_11760 [Rhizobium grahamii]|uniref:Uncharacterized protein n=1 Tax=Rhizobium grahamii TaxID=1120045 RepID=A0A370KSN3_9HYPH|nr:hypothetical protein B5K06_11760 [Rhizobium grahamii]